MSNNDDDNNNDEYVHNIDNDNELLGSGTYGFVNIDSKNPNVVKKNYKLDKINKKFTNPIKSLKDCKLISFEWLEIFEQHLQQINEDEIVLVGDNCREQQVFTTNIIISKDEKEKLNNDNNENFNKSSTINHQPMNTADVNNIINTNANYVNVVKNQFVEKTESIIDKTPWLLRSFLIETICLLKLYPFDKQHDHVVKLIDVDFSKHQMYLVKNLYSIENIKFEDRCNAQFLILAYDMLKAINYVHSFNIIHADIKLENILQSKENIEKYILCDFSISLLDNGSLHYNAKTTWPYMSPEQMANIGFDKYSDTWSFGVTLFTYYNNNVLLTDNINNDLKKIVDASFTNKISAQMAYKQICNLQQDNLNYQLKFIGQIEIRKFLKFVLQVDKKNRKSISQCMDYFAIMYKKITGLNLIEQQTYNNNVTITSTKNEFIFSKTTKQNHIKNWFNLYKNYSTSFFEKTYNLNIYYNDDNNNKTNIGNLINLNNNYIFYLLFKFEPIKQIFIDLNTWSSLHNRLFDQFSLYLMQVYLKKIFEFNNNHNVLTTSKLKIILEKYSNYNKKQRENNFVDEDHNNNWISELFEWVLIGLCKTISKFLDNNPTTVKDLIYFKIKKDLYSSTTLSSKKQKNNINNDSFLKQYFETFENFFNILLNYVEFDCIQWIFASCVNKQHDINLKKS